ncbi:MAG TPA: TIGR03118 family protein [Gaiellaceae bacterium]|jgi:uncharacterized protein (TIGR03118 family)|nr:TIGR03118 family protein [Gaiellaceae bacterium]
MRTRHLQRAFVAAAVLAVAAAVLAAATPAAEKNAYVQHNLVSDGFLPADHTDANLVNAWGLTSLPGSPWWVADNGTDVSTLYTADGTPRPLVVSVPNAPTGAVSNTGPDFVVGSGPALFLFATEEGKILGWNMSLGTTAQVVVDRSAEDAIYKGLAIAGDRLYATDFHNGTVDVFDGSFGQVNVPGAFVDPTIPASFAPFGIQNVGGNIFVTYAKQDADREDDVAGPGLGFVDEFDASGALIGRVASHGQLNSPWGLAPAPAGFGRFSGDLLVGNFGDGQITAFERQSNGRFEPRGQLRTESGGVLTIDGLWALQFGKGTANNGPTDTLFFTAGPDDEMHGLFGTIRAAG